MNNIALLYSKKWRQLTGASDNIFIRQRTFNIVCIFSFVGIVISIIFNYAFNLVQLATLQSGFLLLLIIIYYLSRVRQACTAAYVLYGIANYLSLSVTY